MAEETKQEVTKKTSIWGGFQTINPPESSRDPLKRMIEIAKDSELSDEDKKELIRFATTRFQNRRKMAYLALYVIVAIFALIVVGAFIDGLAGTDIVDELEEVQTIIIWGFGFLTTIVGAYYGVTTLRPSS